MVFLILDPQDEQYDKKLGRHLVSLYFKDESAEEDENFSMKVLRDYIKYAKDKYSPVLSDEAGQKMISYYVEMRKVILPCRGWCLSFSWSGWSREGPGDRLPQAARVTHQDVRGPRQNEVGNRAIFREDFYLAMGFFSLFFSCYFLEVLIRDVTSV